MIDNIKARYRCQHTSFGNQWKEIDENGLTKSYRKFKMISNPSSPGLAKLKVRSLENGAVIEIEGSLAKFFQGTNAFGSMNLKRLSFEAFKLVTQYLDITPTETELRDVKSGNVRLLHLEIAKYAHCGSSLAVAQAILALRQVFFSDEKSVAAYFDETVYPRYRSKYWSFRIYNKHAEMLADKTLSTLPFIDRLLDEVKGLIRVEVALEERELARRSLNLVSKWNREKLHKAYAYYFRRLEICNARYLTVSGDIKGLDSATPSVKMAIALVRCGFDLKKLIGTGAFRVINTAALRVANVDLTLLVEDNEKIRLSKLARRFHVDALESPRPNWLVEENRLFPQVLITQGKASEDLPYHSGKTEDDQGGVAWLD